VHFATISWESKFAFDASVVDDCGGPFERSFDGLGAVQDQI
jgi:hypothetical protein